MAERRLRPVTIDSIRSHPGFQTVYNLVVGTTGVFIADSVVVHNKGCFVADAPILKADGQTPSSAPSVPATV